ncbi:MAG: ribosomal-processing cysteine protease Prp [Clostridiales bacterium]|jgi:uncharacterized protein YsxB (DUF464 family)|nr:ribosomal-processing cysteine protease Prp [Clostridiales bacterium]
MIIITLRYYKNSVVGFDVVGHSEKFICSCISFLVINTINSVDVFTKDRFMCKKNDCGHIKFSFINKKNISYKSKVLMDSLELGFISLEKKYKKFVCLKKEPNFIM